MECHCKKFKARHSGRMGFIYSNSGLEALHAHLLFELERRTGWPVHLDKNGFFDHSFDPVVLDHGYCIDAQGLIPLGGMVWDDYDGPVQLQWHRP